MLSIHPITHSAFSDGLGWLVIATTLARLDFLQELLKGLRIELLETESGTFFGSGSPKPSEKGKESLSMLAGELGNLPNKVSIEGHTDSKAYAGVRDYGNWELATDRANAAWRWMQQQGLGQNQVSQVRGFADQRLRKADSPLDAAKPASKTEQAPESKPATGEPAAH